MVASVDAASLVESVIKAKDGDELAQMQVVAATVWAAFSAPDGVRPLYDTVAGLWLASGDIEKAPAGLPQAPLETKFWNGFWPVVDRAHRQTYTPPTATASIATVSSSTHPDFLALAERGALRRFGPSATIGSAPRPDIDPKLWDSSPADSLGHVLHCMMAEQTYDLDIGNKRELRSLPPGLRRVHAHVDRLDGVWRAVAGYDSTDSHLIAFAAFELAQCGHLFSASALAVFATLAHFVIPNSFHLLMHLIAEGWRHGQRTPPLLGIDWQQHWDEPIDFIRERHGIPVYDSVFSKKLFYALPRYAAGPEVS